MLLCGSGCGKLGKRVAEAADVPFEVVETDTFPDGELYVRVPPDIESEKVYYLQSCYPDQNDRFLETMFTLDALSSQNVDIVPLFPYFPYTKQDAVFQDGEALSVRALLHTLDPYVSGAMRFVNAHFLKEPGRTEKWNVPCVNLNAAPLLLDRVVEEHGKVVVALPGKGARRLLPDERDGVTDIVTVETERAPPEERDGAYGDVSAVRMEEAELAGETVVVLDDMIATGGTMARVCKQLQEKGTQQVIAAAVHGLFLNDAEKRIRAYADALYTTDTVRSGISVAPLLADALNRI